MLDRYTHTASRAPITTRPRPARASNGRRRSFGGAATRAVSTAGRGVPGGIEPPVPP
ncbi:hypothetical protein [Ornithinimicrobium kibberense]|uniref:hypothetical protein n=1 Tax=Ornithinimicrobium kibberense TaxID=282060 RepID=UPI00361E23B5